MIRFKKIAGWFLYGIFILLLVEGTLQVYYYATTGGWLFRRMALPLYASDPYRGWGLKPGLQYSHNTNEYSVMYTTNAQGFRTDRTDREYVCPKPADRYRILLLGPSFAFGWGNNYSDTYGAQLERILQESGRFPDKTVEVINAGVPSLGSFLQEKWFDQIGRKYEPDLVIQFVYGMMTVHEPRQTFVVNDQGYLISPDANWKTRFKKRAKRLGIVFYGYLFYQGLTQSNTNGESAEIEGAGQKMIPVGTFSREGSEVVQSTRLFRAFQDQIRQTGARLVVVHFPLSYAVYPEDMKRWKHQGVRNPDAMCDYNARACRYYSDTLGMGCFDLTPMLRQAAITNPERLYYWLDIHWTPRGNRVAAEATADALLRNGDSVPDDSQKVPVPE